MPPERSLRQRLNVLDTRRLVLERIDASGGRDPLIRWVERMRERYELPRAYGYVDATELIDRLVCHVQEVERESPQIAEIVVEFGVEALAMVAVVVESREDARLMQRLRRLRDAVARMHVD